MIKGFMRPCLEVINLLPIFAKNYKIYAYRFYSIRIRI